jgi:HSP20 family molecular chaperone IbpA
MMTRYDPFREALSLRRAMDQLFEQSFVNPSLMSGSPTMLAPMDVCETDNGYEVDVALPGVRPEDIELTVDQNTLTIRGRFSHQNDHLRRRASRRNSKASRRGSRTKDSRHSRGRQSATGKDTTGSREKSSLARLNGR